MSVMCQAVLDVETVIEIKSQNSSFLHGAYLIAIDLSSHFRAMHLFSVQLSPVLKNQHLTKKMLITCSYKWKSPNPGLPSVLD